MSEITVNPGEIQGSIDEQAPDNPSGFMNDDRVKVTLNGDPSVTFSSDTDPLPIDLGVAVTLDMNGRTFHVKEDSNVFNVEQNAWVVDGKIDYTDAGTNYSSSIWNVDTTLSDKFAAGGANSSGGLIRDVDTVGAEGNDGVVYDILADGNPFAGWVMNGCTHHNPGSRWLYGEINDGNHWLNGNLWNNTTVNGGEIHIEFQSADDTAPIRGNHISGAFHPKSRTKWHAYLSGGMIGVQQYDLYSFPNVSDYDEGVVYLETKNSGDRVDKNLWLDHSNTPHPNKTYDHNQGLWVDNTGKSNAFDSWMWDGLMYGSTL